MILHFAAAVAATVLATLQPLPDDGARSRFSINDGWRYASGTLPGAQAAAFRDSDWTHVTLPHTWNAQDGFTEALSYRRGIGWYRRSLLLDATTRSKRLFLHFEGANQVAEVFVNGRAVGRHVGGYTAFTFEITNAVRWDAPNVLAVRVDNSHNADIPPLNADFTFYGGIYRDVWLVATSPVHITMDDHGSSGVFADTPTLSDTAATVRVRGAVMNASHVRQTVDVVSHVRDPEGREVATLRSTVNVEPGKSTAFTQLSATVRNPRLWSPETPSVYRVETEVQTEGTVTDRVDSPLGFRRFAVDAQRGFLLQGKPYRLNGTNRHQDREGFANALPDWAHRADVRNIRQSGFNFLRLAHYPQDPAVLDEADRQGLVLWEEIPVVNVITASPAFAANSERMLVEMIRQHYNHPSVAFWGYMNEVLLQPPRPEPPEYRRQVTALARQLDARAHREDPMRQTITAISFDEIDNGTGLQDIPDVLGFNLYFGWYYRTLDGLGAFLDTVHTRHPTRPLLVSEYGADSDERIHSRAPRAFDFSSDYQQQFHEGSLPQLLSRGWLVGTAVWNQFDFGAKGRHDSKPNLNQKGLYNFDRTPKDIAFYYHAQLLAAPVLRLATRDWPRRAGSRAGDAVQQVKVYTNLREVELFRGDTSLGKQPVLNATATWMVPLRDGTNHLLVRGTRDRAALMDDADVTYDDREPFFRLATSRARDFAVNAGSHYEVTDASGLVWEADRTYEPGSWGRVGGGREQLVHHRIFGTDDHALYQATLDSVRAYRFDVPDGEYEVTLRLVETIHERSGQRVFDVRVNDAVALSRLDLAADYGRYAAVSRVVAVRVRGGRGIQVTFQSHVGATTISGIHIRRQ